MKRIRYSLLSLLVGVVMAGACLWLNLRPVKASVEESMELGPVPPGSFKSVDYLRYGWPFASRLEQNVVEYDSPDFSYVGIRIWRWYGLAANIAIGLAVVFGCAVGCEYGMRRCKGRFGCVAENKSACVDPTRQEASSPPRHK